MYAINGDRAKALGAVLLLQLGLICTAGTAVAGTPSSSSAQSQ